MVNRMPVKIQNLCKTSVKVKKEEIAFDLWMFTQGV